MSFIHRDKILSVVKPFFKNNSELKKDTLPASPEIPEDSETDADDTKPEPQNPVIIYNNDTIKKSANQEKNDVKKTDTCFIKTQPRTIWQSSLPYLYARHWFGSGVC